MRKSLILLLVTVTLFFGGICYISLRLNNVKDQVTYEELISYGDSSAAEGLTVNNNIQFDQKIFWDTTYRAGKNASTTTDYRFYTSNQPSEYVHTDYFQMDSFWDGYSSSHDEYPLIFKDLADETAPGKTGFKRIYLKDFYEYYPISVDIGINDRYHAGWDAFYLENSKDSESELKDQVQAFNDFFRIPLVASHSMEIEVGKNSDGTISFTSSSATDEDYFHFDTWSVVTKQAIYFTFDAHTMHGNLIDTSLIPGGYGIYRLPYTITEGKNTFTVNAKNLSMVYPLDPKNTISSMDLTKDGSSILLFSTDEEKGGSQLIVIDTTTMKTAQIIPVPGIPLEDGATEILHASDTFIYEDFVCYSLSGDYLALFSLKENDTLELTFVQPVYPDPNFYYWIHSESYMDWNGEKLAVASPNNLCDFSLAVYDRTGLLYFAHMQGSLGKGVNSFEHGYIMNQETKEPFLTVEWTK